MTEYPAAGQRAAYAAQLRVYEPIAAFDAQERAHWEAYAVAGSAPSPQRGPGLEREAGLAALLGLVPAILPDLPEHAYVQEVDGVTLVCPWRTQVRAWQAVAEVRGELPDVLADAFVPRRVADAAEAALAGWLLEHPERHVHVLSTTWQVPARWFVLVDAAERMVNPGLPDGAAGAPPGRRTGRALVYRTAMSRARRRAARALAVLRRTLDDGGAAAGVEDLGRWLEEFHPRSMVELDYGGLVHLLDDDALAEDESARDVAEALGALGEGEGERAAAAYGRVTARMKALQAVESAG